MSIKRTVKKLIAKYASIDLHAIYVTEEERFRGKTVAITGGTGDIARAVCDRFVSMGANVVLIGRNEEKLKRLANDHIKYVLWDVTDIAAADEKVREAGGRFGRIDIWVNSAGVISENDLVGDFFRATEDDWDRQFNVNAKSLYFLTQAVCRYYIDNGIRNSHIVQILSIDGIRNTWKIYGLSKRISIGLTKGIAKLVAPYGIIVNGVAPGGVATRMISAAMQGENDLRKNSVPTSRLSTPVEIANCVVFLAGDDSMQLVGSVIVCDGGNTL